MERLLACVRLSYTKFVAVYDKNDMYIKIAFPDVVGVLTCVDTLNFPCLVDESLATTVLTYYVKVKTSSTASDMAKEKEMEMV